MPAAHSRWPRTPAAGVRKPPREETAMSRAMGVPRYGDLDLGAARSLGRRVELMLFLMLLRRLRR